MPKTKQAKRRKEVVPALGVIGVSLSIASGASAAAVMGPVSDIPFKDTGDFNGDGKSDVLWQGQDGTPAIWTMDGTHVLSVGVAGSFNPGADWHVI